MDRDRGRLGERGRARRERLGHAHERGSRARACTGRTRRGRSRADRAVRAAGTPRAGPRRQARHSPQPGVGSSTTRAPSLPAGDVGAERGDRARPFVAEHRARARETLEHEMEIGAADPAVRNLDERVVGAERGNRELLHLDVAVADVHGGGHESGVVVDHPASLSDPALAAEVPELQRRWSRRSAPTRIRSPAAHRARGCA